MRREPEAVAAVMEGLVITGIAMSYAGVSRPASGMEHYFSHIWDMRGLAFGTAVDTHGIQCGIATLTTVRAYENLMHTAPDPEKALAAVRAWDNGAWNAYLTEKLGDGANAIIRGEEKERKYDAAKHEARLGRILAHWNDILSILGDLPSADGLESFMKRIGHPTSPASFGLDETMWDEAFLMAKDIRDKYVLGRLLWDLGDETMHRFRETP
jgi:glycerol-1-phosphate dehydrogenase [NAD(P)+]